MLVLQCSQTQTCTFPNGSAHTMKNEQIVSYECFFCHNVYNSDSNHNWNSSDWKVFLKSIQSI